MAHLQVEPKPKRPSWVWILVIVILVALGATLFKYCRGGVPPTADTTAQPSTVEPKP